MLGSFDIDTTGRTTRLGVRGKSKTQIKWKANSKCFDLEELEILAYGHTHCDLARGVPQ